MNSNFSGDVYQRGDIHLTRKGEEIIVRSIFDQLMQDFPNLKDKEIKSKKMSQKYFNKSYWFPIEQLVEYISLEYGNGGYIKQYEGIGTIGKKSEKFYEKGYSEKYVSDFSFYSIGVCYSHFIYRKFSSLFRASTFIRPWTGISSMVEKEQMENHLHDMLLDINSTSKAIVLVTLVIDEYYLDKHLYPLESVLEKYK